MLWLVSLGTILGTRPRHCTPIDFVLVVCETGPDIRVRIRRIVIRVRVRHTAIRVRVVVRAVNHTACGKLHHFGCKVTELTRTMGMPVMACFLLEMKLFCPYCLDMKKSLYLCSDDSVANDYRFVAEGGVSNHSSNFFCIGALFLPFLKPIPLLLLDLPLNVVL